MVAKIKDHPFSTMVPETTEWQYAAVCALMRGQATEKQQIDGMDWIIKNAAGLGSLGFDTDPAIFGFHNGRRWLGRLLVRMVTEPRETFITVKEKKHG